MTQLKLVVGGKNKIGFPNFLGFGSIQTHWWFCKPRNQRTTILKWFLTTGIIYIDSEAAAALFVPSYTTL